MIVVANNKLGPLTFFKEELNMEIATFWALDSLHLQTQYGSFAHIMHRKLAIKHGSTLSRAAIASQTSVLPPQMWHKTLFYKLKASAYIVRAKRSVLWPVICPGLRSWGHKVSKYACQTDTQRSPRSPSRLGNGHPSPHHTRRHWVLHSPPLSAPIWVKGQCPQTLFSRITPANNCMLQVAAIWMW